MHVYFISHHFFISLFTKYKVNKIKNQFFVIKKKKKTDFRAFKKKLDQKKKITLCQMNHFSSCPKYKKGIIPMT